MYRKALALTLLGVLLVGSGAVAYGTVSGDGLPASLAAVMGGDDDDDDDHDHERGRDGWRGFEEDDDDHDHDDD